jgi:hypothetical protein
MSGVNVPSHFVQQYANTIDLLLQQKGSKLRDKVTSGSYMGKQASPVDQVGAISMLPVGSRFAPMGRVDSPLDRRWILPSDFELPQLLDSFDEHRLLIDPKSKYVQNAVYAAGRQVDDLIIESFFGTAKTGETGATSTSFPAGQQVAVNFGAASNTGLTVSKLREAKRILMANEVDFDSDEIIAVVTAKQHDNLLAEAQIISTEFNEKPVLVEGKVTRFMGITIVHCERLDIDGSSYRRIPIFAKSGMHLGIWGDIMTAISQREDLSGRPWQAYVKMTMGATRLEEKKIVEVKCAE